MKIKVPGTVYDFQKFEIRSKLIAHRAILHYLISLKAMHEFDNIAALFEPWSLYNFI